MCRLAFSFYKMGFESYFDEDGKEVLRQQYLIEECSGKPKEIYDDKGQETSVISQMTNRDTNETYLE